MRYIDWKTKKKQIREATVVLALVLGITQFATVSASTIDDATNKKNEAQNALNSTNNDISRIENEQQRLQGEIDALDAELVEVILNLSILENDLTVKEEELVQVQADLKQAQEDEENQYNAMKKRIRFMYERGDTAFLTSMLESESIPDLLNRVEYFNEVYDYDRELLVTYQTTKLKVAELEVQVQGEIAEMEEMQVNYQEEQSRYETLIARKRGQMSDFDTQLANAQQLAAQYQATIDEQNEIIRKEEERQRKEEEERQRREEEARRAAAAAAAASNRNNTSGGNSSGNGSSGGSSGGSGSSGGNSGKGNLNPSFTTGVSGSDVVNYACGFIGKPYVWGGTDPNTGADCSGFIQYVYRQYGVSLPRTSYEQRSAGREVSYSNAQPGDIICYSGHVAIYMGGGQIVHVSSSAPYPVGGIKTGTATYRTIVSVRRVL